MSKIKNKVGPWVSEEDFWDRDEDVENLRRLLNDGENVLLVAPRRIGKTSLVHETFRRMETSGECCTLYVDVQHCTKPEDAVVELSKATRKHGNLWKRTLEGFKSTFGDLWGKIGSLDLHVIELKLREGTADAWQSRGDRLLESLAKEGRPIFICIDELPVMLTRLIGPEGKGKEQAGIFLSWLRKACGTYQKQIHFVLCGSIGLEPVARYSGLSHTLAHLRPFRLEPWTSEVADGCLEALAKNYDIELPSEIRGAMLDRLGCLIPHHVQMYFGHVLEDVRRRKARTATLKDVRRIYEQQMLGTRGHAELADYEERLLRVLGPQRTALALDLLTEAAVVGRLTDAAMPVLLQSNAAGLADPQATLRSVLDTLEHDGYLIRARKGHYKFVPSLIADWWKRRFGMGYVPAAKRKA